MIDTLKKKPFDGNTGSEPNIFQGRLGVLHFDKHFIYNTQEKTSQRKSLEL